MKIEEEDYILEYDDNCDRFDLDLIYVKNAKDPAKRSEEFKNYGYAMHLDQCIRVIINHRIAKQGDVYSMQEYLNKYAIEREKICNSINLAPVIRKLLEKPEPIELNE